MGVKAMAFNLALKLISDFIGNMEYLTSRGVASLLSTFI